MSRLKKPPWSHPTPKWKPMMMSTATARSPSRALIRTLPVADGRPASGLVSTGSVIAARAATSGGPLLTVPSDRTHRALRQALPPSPPR